MSACAVKRALASDATPHPQANVEWSNVSAGVVRLHPEVQKYLDGKISLRAALAQWQNALRAKFAPASVYSQVDLMRDPDSSQHEIALVVSVDLPGPEARRLMDEVIRDGLPPEADAHFDDVDIVLIGR